MAPALPFVVPCSKAGEVVGLEQRKRALELGMAERRQEIAAQMELMQAGRAAAVVNCPFCGLV